MTVSDRKLQIQSSTDPELVEAYMADVVSANDYYPFGQLMPGKQYGQLGRYGFNGKEQDPEIKGSGTQYDYGFRVYDPRVARFLSVDPLFKGYPWYTPYQFAGNKPIISIDLDGLEEVEVNGITITLTTGVYPKIQKQAAELVKSNPNQLAAMQQEAWNKVLSEIDAIVPKYFDYKHNLNGILWNQYIAEVESIILDSKATWQFNSLYNYDNDNYIDINPLLKEAANDLANDHYRASINSKEFYEKYINSINKAKDPNTKAALISERSSKSWGRIIAFQQACIQAAMSFLEMMGYGKATTTETTLVPRSKYYNFSSHSGGGLRFVRNASGEIEDLHPTIERIAAGRKFPHRNDGAVFRNDDGLLPLQPKGYYREYVHPTNGVKGPGAQRIVTGQGGEQYYTPDHYKTFIQMQ